MLLGVSGSVGVEVWNSYRTNYPNATTVPIPTRDVYIQADGDFSAWLTNLSGEGTWFTNYALGGPPIRGGITVAPSDIGVVL